MIERIRNLLRLGGTRPRAVLDLPSAFDRARVAELLEHADGLPHLNWARVVTELDSHASDSASRDRLLRSIVAAWLDELRDALTTDSRRWRRALVEGVAPIEGTIAMRAADSADRAFRTVVPALAKITGDTPPRPLSLVVAGTQDEYYAFAANFFSDGHFATSGGLYIREGEFPTLLINSASKLALEDVIAHELTHHRLSGCNLPAWAEEGLTQMMEERVTGMTSFRLDSETLDRHRQLWGAIGYASFLDGDAFTSPEDDRQELAYHLSQVIVRSMLATRADQFFAFARSCRDGPSSDAVVRHCGEPIESLLDRALRL